MNITNPEIFKKYDIRGKFLEDIDHVVIRKLVRAYISIFRPDEVVVGHDPLEGSSKLYPHLCDEFAQLGVKVFEVGQVSSPMLYFASSFHNITQGIMLTASHFGVGHAGMKIVINGLPPLPEQIIKMRQIVDTVDTKDIYRGQRPIETINRLLSQYKKHLFNIAKPEKGNRQYKIVIDSGNGPNGLVARDLYKKYFCDFTVINEKPKGDNLSHGTNPKLAENRQQLADKITDTNSDYGVLWDGDGDRAYFLDWKGNIIPPEFVGAVIGEYLIRKGLGTTMTVDVRACTAVEDHIRSIKGKVKRIQARHVPIKHEMEADKNIVFGMETSGHFVFRDFYKIDDGLLTSLFFLNALNNSKNSLNKMLSEFRDKYKIIEEINFKTTKSEETLVEELKLLYPEGKVIDIDGITIEYPDWRFNIRASRSEPIIRLNISGTDFEKVSENLELLKSHIGGEIL